MRYCFPFVFVPFFLAVNWAKVRLASAGIDGVGVAIEEEVAAAVVMRSSSCFGIVVVGVDLRS